MDQFDLYKDMKSRTNGEIYIGVVGPVRTGKSTFIKKFMELFIIPQIADEHEKERVIDELPQAAAGRTVMTTEPKFIPKDASKIVIDDHLYAKFRLIDCVGYVVEGATGIYEDGKERNVKTPWYEEEIPFSKAAEYGTDKVIKDHATIGIVITCDGSIGEIPRKDYQEAETRAINELTAIGKPFIIIVNSKNPQSAECKEVVKELSEKYPVCTLALNCERMNHSDAITVLTKILYEFPVEQIELFQPAWVRLLEEDNPVKEEVKRFALETLNRFYKIKDLEHPVSIDEYQYFDNVVYDEFDFENGTIRARINIKESCYYDNLSKLTGEQIQDEYELIETIRRLSEAKKEYGLYIEAIKCVQSKGYGVVVPGIDQIEIDKPQIFKNGNKYGVKIKAQSPSIHMIKVTIGTEISPIVGNEEQANDLIQYMNDTSGGSLTDANIFGKSVGQLVEEGINSKIQLMNDECQLKLQEAMQKVVNEQNGGLVCLII